MSTAPRVSAFTYLGEHLKVAGLLIFSLSFVIRCSILMTVPRVELLSTGEPSHIADALISKGRFADPFAAPTGPTAHLTPFFPLLLAGEKEVFGSGYTGALVRCFLVIGAYSLLYALYPKLASHFGFPVSAGIFAGFLAALLPVKRSAEIFRGWEEPYAAMALALLMGLTLKCWQRQDERSSTALATGAAWGLALYISVSLLPVLAGLLAVGLFSSPSTRAWRNSALVVFAAAAVISPWLIRNRVELGGWTLMRTGLGQNLRCSNHDGARASIELINTDPVSKRMYPLNSVAESEKVRLMGELAYDRYERRLAFDWIGGHPRQFAVLSLERFLYFWAGPKEHWFEFVITSLYTILGGVGLFLMRKRVGPVQFRLWCTALVTYPVVYYFIQYGNRYRVPIDWLIWLSAGLVIVVAVDPPVSATKETTEVTVSSAKSLGSAA